MKWLTTHHLDASAHTRISFGLLIVRIVMGLAMMFHGWPKIQNAFGWMGPDAAIPGIFQALAALAEFGGGLALLLGLLTSLASIGMLITMAVAATFHISKGDPFVGYGASWELAAVYFSLSFLFLVTGPGYFSVDNKIFKK